MVILLALWLPGGASAAMLEPVGSFDQPIFVTSDPGDADRLLVVERDGRVIEVTPGGSGVLADLTEWVSCCTGERGLLSIAPAPDFAATGRFYAAYAGTAEAGGAVGELHVDAFLPDGGGGIERQPVIAIDHPDVTHYGGQIQLGPDDHLYISVGDGGGAGDPDGNGQSLDTMLGKILRIEPHPGETPTYEIPPGNPFDGAGELEEIWSYGLRNPWRFSFDRAGGDMVIGDVGQGLHEEVDLALSPGPGLAGGGGANYGWNCREGLFPYPLAPGSCTGASGFTDPVFDYPHDDPGTGEAHGCSIIGGYVAQDPSLAELFGRYVYSDLCEGEIRSLELPGTTTGTASGDRSEGLELAFPVSFGEDAGGRLYVASSQGGVYRLVSGAPGSGPSIPSPASAAVGPSLADAPPPLRLVLLREGRASRRGVALRARVFPCGEGVEGPVRLKRGGRPLAAKPLDRACSARFRARVLRRATFRALLEPPGGGEPIRSRRLVVSLGE